nr:MAG TPA: hypothetical protein [Caudoviricetes sp.]
MYILTIIKVVHFGRVAKKVIYKYISNVSLECVIIAKCFKGILKDPLRYHLVSL